MSGVTGAPAGGTSNALQAWLYRRLLSDAGVAALVGDRVYDMAPLKAVLPYVSFGASVVTPDDADCIAGGTEVVQIDIWSEAQDGQREAKAIVAAVRACLRGQSASLSEGALASLEVLLVRVIPDADGVTTHGVVQVEAAIEEAGA